MAWFHLTLSVDGRLPLGIDAPTRRRARHQLLRLHGDRIGSLALCDDHGHLLVEDQAQHVGFLAGGVRRSLQAIAQRPVHAHLRPVDERSHLLRLLAYHAEQPARHGFPGHPVLWPDGSAGDLVGARRTPGFRPELVRRWLPRWKPADLLAALRIPDPGTAPLRHVAELELPALVELCHHAFDADPATRSPHRTLARRVAATLAQRSGATPADIARALSVRRQRVRAYLRHPPHDDLVTVVLRRLALTVAPTQPAPSHSS